MMRPLELAATPPAQRGGKGTAIAWLQEAGFRTPRTWVVPPDVEADLSGFDGETRFAVRSSANVEDGRAASFAGQFLTQLGVVGAADLTTSIAAVRASASSQGVSSYSAHVHSETAIQMSVLLQEMIEPVASGVVFTRNPITGLNEVVLEAVLGTGEKLVAGGVTPQRWVRRWGAWTTHPSDPILPDAVTIAAAQEASAIAEAYGTAADLEWVWDGSDLWWVQIRPITGIKDVRVFSNRISKEVLPGLIKPLVWSVNVPVVNRAWIELFTEAIGRNTLAPDDLAQSFAYRAYFNMGAIGDIFELMGMRRDSLETLLGLTPGPDQPRMQPTAKTMTKTPRLVAFSARKMRFGAGADSHARELSTRFSAYDVELSSQTDAELLAGIDDLMELSTEAAHANIIVPLLANLYTALLRKRLDRQGVDIAEIELAVPGEEENELDPNVRLGQLGSLVAERGRNSPEVDAALNSFLEDFGHFSDSGNDFSIPTWKEQPDLVLDMAEVRRDATRGDPTPWSEARAKLGPMARFIAGPIRKRARNYQVRREQVSSVYTYGYGMFRTYFLELGGRLSERGLIETPDDIMYLTLDEVRQATAGELPATSAGETIAYHKAEMDRVAHIGMPEIVYGDHFIPVASDAAHATLEGVATSRGHYRGTLRVVSGIADIGRVKQGDVLAIPFSDVGWTPLFARAGAVIAESGGMLSHSSIVAREYGIPCVVSVPGAMRLPDGATVTVDGYRGVITVD